MKFLRRKKTIRGSVLGTILAVALIALTVCGSVVGTLQANAVRTRVAADLEKIEEEFRALASKGVDPGTGRPFNKPLALLNTFMTRSVLNQGEAEMAFVGGKPELSLVSASDVLFRPEDDPELVEKVRPWANGSQTVIETVKTKQGQFRVLVAPVKAGEDTGAFVHIIDMDAKMADLRDTMMRYVLVGLFTIALIMAWARPIVARLLRPIEELRSAAESIDESDLTSRVPVRSDDDLGLLAHAFNRMLDRVQEASDAQRRLLDDVGHELRTPLTILQGHLELLDTGSEEDIKATRDLLLDETQRMGGLVQQILVLAKASQTDFLTKGPVDIADLTEQVLNKARVLGPRNWQLIHIVECEAYLDSARITQAWLQLADNAVKYSAEGARIGIGSQVVGPNLYLWVEDAGIGIPADEIDSIRQRFSRGGGASSMASGSGLGLSVVESIMSAHGGQLLINSTEGVGSVFTLSLPLESPTVEDA
ncbi:MAG: HAMP domain-containing sensor histidine kinase [Actinomycetaceae bacterium]|nr:HAMP domain-containing sensor histidine kinase [Actinomycetaceae bacterium]